MCDQYLLTFCHHGLHQGPGCRSPAAAVCGVNSVMRSPHPLHTPQGPTHPQAPHPCCCRGVVAVGKAGSFFLRSRSPVVGSCFLLKHLARIMWSMPGHLCLRGCTTQVTVGPRAWLLSVWETWTLSSKEDILQGGAGLGLWNGLRLESRILRTFNRNCLLSK